jgi:hypothetical protein
MKRFACGWLVLCAWTGCDNGTSLSPVVPSAGEPFQAELAREVGLRWSPYVGVQVDGGALRAYEDALSILQRAGRLRGVRVEISKNSQTSGDPVIRAVGALGIELLGLIDNEYLFAQDIEQEIDQIFAAYPEIRYFQIGNEITTILPSTGPTITIGEYWTIFQRIYNHVQNRHPGRATLLTQSTLGAGLRGPSELETMASSGLARMDPNKVIVAVNAYDPDSVSQYRGVVSGPLRNFRVWVTESGVADSALHIPYVQDRYPLLRNYLRAERVYWYILWGGDSGNDTDFGLIKSPGNYPRYWKSPLFELLAGPL